MANLMPQGKQQYLDSAGAPLAGGKLYTYAAGTSTPLATYSDQAGTIPNANPVVLDARGEATIFWGSAGYKVVLKDSADVTIWTQDNLYVNGTDALDGTAGAPSYSFASDTDTGLYRIGADNIGLSLGGVKRWDFGTAGSTLTGTLTASGLATLSGGIAGSITDGVTTELNANAIRVKDAGITGAKLATSAADGTTLEVASGAMRIKDLGVGTAKLAANAVTRAKMEAVGQQLSASCGQVSTVSDSYADVANLSVTITTTGRPVLLALVPVGGTNQSYLQSPGSAKALFVRILRDGATCIALWICGLSSGTDTCFFPLPGPAFDVPTAGTYAYKVQIALTSPPAGTGWISYAKLLAYEL